MSQTRTFLILAWLMVATLLWMEWGKDQQATTPAAIATAATDGTPIGGVPAVSPVGVPGIAVPAPVSASASAQRVQLRNDVLDLSLDGNQVVRAELLAYRQTRDAGSPPVVLFDPDPAQLFFATSAWRGANGQPIPLQPEDSARAWILADGASQVEAVFTGKLADGVIVHRTYRLARGSYALRVHDEVTNAGTSAWTGQIDRSVQRIPPEPKRGLTNPEAFSLSGAAWYSPEDKYQKRKYPDFADKPLDPDAPKGKEVKAGWIALSQHYFLTAWIPQPDQGALYSLTVAGALHGIDADGPQATLAPGQRITSDATLWVGPKLAAELAPIAPGLDRAMDYGYFTVLSQPIHWLLTKLHLLTRNWGWAIVLLVILIKLVLYPLSAAQYKSMAKMRKFQPRIEQLKERYGDDKQKFQMAMLELYKKEKINPAGGCLPILIQMPVFLALYYVLIEAVELRQAPWILGWINDLTSRDPYFILPVVNGAVMWLTQKMTPMVGMDPMQKKMMQMMPLVMAVMFAFFPAGLVLYWVTNGTLGMLQQWWNTKRYAEAPAAT
jgi:YidC/Oxa1 family membrane protein insertase